MKKLIVLMSVLALVVGALGVLASADPYVAKIGAVGYGGVEDAVAAADTQTIVLQADVDSVQIPSGKVVSLDLNGCKVKDVAVADDAELYVLDSKTDDYDDSDCGWITGTVTGDVYAMQVSEYELYVMLRSSEGLSFHRLFMYIDAAVLSPDRVGISYRTEFYSTGAVASVVDTYGVALSVVDEPQVVDGVLSDHCEVTELRGFQGGAAGNTGKSSEVAGVMKQTNGYLDNVGNSRMDIYGKPYIKLGDTYVLGAPVCYSFKEIAEEANKEDVWSAQTPGAQIAMGEMYRTFAAVMNGWAVPKVVEQAEKLEQGVEDRTFKILTLGHSLALDSGHLLALIADAQGLPEEYDEFIVGTLYKSGCNIYEHVNFLTDNSTSYSLYLSSTKTADQIPTITDNVTMSYALSYDNWDMIIMQGGVFEIAKDATYTDGKIEIIQDYVRARVQNPDIKFAWHMQWAPPTDEDLRGTYPYTPNWYVSSYEPYGDDRLTLYNTIAGCVEKNVLPNETFEFIIPSGTAMQNAWSSSFTEKQLHRDYVHASEYGRAISSYTWYCRLFGVDQLDEIKLDEIPKQFFHASRPVRTEPELTQLEKDVLLESVNNALKTPFAMTQSQYVTAQ